MTPCNHCGRCCLEETCYVAESFITAMKIIDRHCPALIYQDGLWKCDLYMRPWIYNKVLKGFATKDSNQEFLDLLSKPIRDVFSKSIGRGCDADFDPSELIPIQDVDAYLPLPSIYQDQIDKA